MDTKNNKIFDFDDVNFLVKEKLYFWVFYHFVIDVADKSSKKPINVYINTNKGDHHLFETWDIVPPSDTTKNWAKVKDKDLVNFTK